MPARISPKLAIIAASARPYAVAAANSGYQVAAFDVFNDVDTRRCCFYSAAVRYRDGGFDAEALLDQLATCDLDDAAILYGSGLEGQPQLLRRIADRYRLVGNPPDVVAAVKQPRRFFSLLDSLSIAYPETIFEPPHVQQGWLAKCAGGSGGTHVRLAGDGIGDYWQQQILGDPVSLLFLADGHVVEPVGYNLQWLAPTLFMPFRYGGSVGHAALPEDAKSTMLEAACEVALAAGLRGLNSMDFVLGEDGPLALEINPRLSASFERYPQLNLLERHIAACTGTLPPPAPADRTSHAGLICYADRDLVIPHGFAWPDWATDIPPAGSRIAADAPLCSVTATAEDAFKAAERVFARAHQVKAQCRNL